MSDWVVVLVIGVLFVAIVLLAVVLFFLRQEQSHQERVSEEPPVVGPRPGIAPVIKPRIVLRKRPVQHGKFNRREIAETTLTRKQILGNQAVGLPQAQPNGTPVVPLQPNHVSNGNPGPKLRTREIKIELDDICKVSGIAIRECPCLECQEMRADVGS